MNISARAQWLQTHTCLGDLSEDLVCAIATHLSEESIAANRRLILEDDQPEALYILKSGRVESYRTQQVTMASVINHLSGSMFHLQEILLDQPTERTLVTLTDCTLWTLPRQQLKQIAQDYPELNQELSQLLAQELAQG